MSPRRTLRENRVITDGPRPKHAQLSDVLADLAAHELGPDAAIPSEREQSVSSLTCYGDTAARRVTAPARQCSCGHGGSMSSEIEGDR